MSRKKRRSKRSSKTDHPYFFSTTRLDTGITFSFEVAKRDARHMQTYLAAHMLLPEGYDAADPSGAVWQEQALSVLASSDPEEADLVTAIVILGHSPSSSAAKALADYGASGRPYAGMARVALGECAGLLDEASCRCAG